MYKYSVSCQKMPRAAWRQNTPIAEWPPWHRDMGEFSDSSSSRGLYKCEADVSSKASNQRSWQSDSNLNLFDPKLHKKFRIQLRMCLDSRSFKPIALKAIAASEYLVISKRDCSWRFNFLSIFQIQRRYPKFHQISDTKNDWIQKTLSKYIFTVYTWIRQVSSVNKVRTSTDCE